MSNRITRTLLAHLCTRINALTGSHQEPYKDGKPQVGNHFIERLFGDSGYRLMRISNEQGGEEDIFRSGPVAAKDIANLMAVYIKGIETGKGLK